jgi:very-short-patch-repair endonuclease
MLSWLLRVFQGLFRKESQPEPAKSATSYEIPFASKPTSADRDGLPVSQLSDIGEIEDGGATPRYAYALRDDFLTLAEASFFRVLCLSVGDDLLIFPKVRLADLVYAPKQDAQYGAWQKINRKHVDFVLCAVATLRPQLVIELDDRSHRWASRIERDAFVDGIFADVGLPILRVQVEYAYATTQLAALITEAIQGADRQNVSDSAPVSLPEPITRVPRCERCGGEMRLRTAAQGKHSGEQFWGCTNYPRCRSIVPIQPIQMTITGS